MTKSTILTLALLCWSVPAGANALSGILISNPLSPALNNGTNNGFQDVAFTIGSTSVDLTAVNALVGAVGLSAGTVFFDLYNDVAGLPGNQLLDHLGSVTLSAGDASQTFTLTGGAPFFLSANTTYWLQASFDTPGGPRWDQGNPAQRPTNGLATYVGYEYDGTATGTSFGASIVYNAVELDGIATPEPSAALLLAFGGLGLLLFQATGKGRRARS